MIGTGSSKPGKRWKSRSAYFSKPSLFLFLAFLLPSLAIAFFSFHSLKKEAVARKHLILQTFGHIGQLVAKEIDQQIEAVDRQIFEELVSTGSDRLSDQLRVLEDAHPEIRPLLLLEADEGRGGSKTVDIDTLKPTSLSPRFESQFRKAERVELRNDAPELAAQLYGQAYRQAVSSHEQMLALNGQARCLYKMGEYRQALEAYRLLVETVPPRNPQQLKGVLSAHYQITQCLLALKDKEALSEATVALLQFLVRHASELGHDSYLFYRLKLDTALNTALKTNPSDELSILLDQDRRIRSVLPLLAQAKEAAGRIPLGQSDGQEAGNIHYLSLSPESKAFAAFFRYDETGEIGGAGSHAVIHLWTVEDVITLVRDLAAKPGPWSETGVSVRSEDGEILLSTTSRDLIPEGIIASRLRAIPHLELVAYPLSGSPDEIVKSELRTYSILIFLVALAVVGGLYLTLRGVSRELSLARLRSDFVAGVSHEFKTPLSLIRLHVENLRSGWVKEEKRQEYYEVITREAERLSGLVDNALSLARIEAGTEHYNRRPIDLSRLVEKTIEGYRPHLEEKNISLSIHGTDKPIMVEGDRDALERMLINLLSNAAKYMREDERKIEALLDTGSDHVRLEVIDTGVGISEVDLEKVFDKFFRSAHQPDKPVAGSGVGLTLAKHIVDGHQGQLSVESKVGSGSKFSVRLPLMDTRTGV